MKKYWRLGTTSAFAATGLSAVPAWIFLDQAGYILLLAVCVGSGAGICMAVAAYIGDGTVRDRGYDVSATQVRQEHDLTVEASPTPLFAICCEVLESFDGASLVLRDAGQLKVAGRTPRTWRSAGEHIQIVIRQLSAGQSRIWILSRPIARTSIIDCGKNLENVVLMKEAIQARLSEPGAWLAPVQTHHKSGLSPHARRAGAALPAAREAVPSRRLQECVCASPPS